MLKENSLSNKWAKQRIMLVSKVCYMLHLLMDANEFLHKVEILISKMTKHT